MKQTTRGVSDIQEKRVSSFLNMRIQPNSGATTFRKGDLADANWIIECKTSMTVKNAYSIKRKDLSTLESNRFTSGKNSCALVFSFGDDHDYAVLKESMLHQLMLNAFKEAYKEDLYYVERCKTPTIPMLSHYVKKADLEYLRKVVFSGNKANWIMRFSFGMDIQYAIIDLHLLKELINGE